MLFNTLEFAIFLPIVFVLYWSFEKKKWILLLASYFFYASWDYRFLSLLLLSSFTDYTLAHLIDNKPNNSKKRKILLGISIFINLGILIYFKYANFFIDTFCDTFRLLGIHFSTTSMQLILPLGISFYTFQTLSYTIDVYYKRIPACKNLLSFLIYVSYFPQLVAGPIEKAQTLLPQFTSKKKFKYRYAVDGMRQMAWGTFKKVVIADNCALYVDYYFDNFHTQNGVTLLFIACLFSFQIYTDFSGYSDMGIGISKLFGIELSDNFKQPYFSRNFYEFWKRWHISLNNWFRDYVYIPLGGNKKPFRNIIVVFLISGLWHGASWNFVAWGAIHSLLYMSYIFLKNKKKYTTPINADSPTLITEFLSVLLTFLITTLAWVFFRASSITQAIAFIKQLTTHFSGKINVLQLGSFPFILLFFLILAMLSIEWYTRYKPHPMSNLEESYKTLPRFMIYTLLIITILFLGGGSQAFIYFQF